MLMFVAEVATNLEAPAVTLDAGFACKVEFIVSMPFATKYVLKYNVKTRRNGLETRNACGRAIAGRTARRKHDLNVVFVAAFSMIDLLILSENAQKQSSMPYLSMVQTTGATRNPAAIAEAASAPARRPRLWVFHLETFSCFNGFFTAGRWRDSGAAIKDEVTAGFLVAASLLLRVSSCTGI